MRDSCPKVWHWLGLAMFACLDSSLPRRMVEKRLHWPGGANRSIAKAHICGLGEHAASIAADLVPSLGSCCILVEPGSGGWSLTLTRSKEKSLPNSSGVVRFGSAQDAAAVS